MCDVDLNMLQQKIAELEERLKQYKEPIDRFYQANLRRINHWNYYPADFERELHQFKEKQDSQTTIRQEVNEFIGMLCSVYLTSTGKECAQIRELFDKRKHLTHALLQYSDLASKEIKAPADVQWLRLGLAAISIQNCGDDFRDGAMTLTNIYEAAEKAGMNPRPFLNEVAQLSSDICPYPNYPNPFSMRSSLLTFADAIEKGRMRLKSQASKSSFGQRLLDTIKRKLRLS
jgi:hypothetical protein